MPVSHRPDNKIYVQPSLRDWNASWKNIIYE